jgi:hypothetical protein
MKKKTAILMPDKFFNRENIMKIDWAYLRKG